MTYETLISAADLVDKLHQADWIIFDARFALADSGAGAKAYRMGHIPGARYVHLNDDLSSPVRSYSGRHPLPDFNRLAKKLGNWGVGNRSQVVVYDDANGAFAARLWWLLRCMGHRQVAVLDGGIQQWQKMGLALTTELPRPQPNSFRAYLDSSQWLSAEAVENALARNDIMLIDARAPERYRGLQEPIDPVAGHVPKAVNRPFQANLQASGEFLPTTQLREQFQQLLGSRPAEQVVQMCGSGVTACHNVLAMEVAGLSGSKLYAGSWSEWIVNRNRAVAR